MIAMISAMLLLAGALDSATAVTIQRTTLDPGRSGHSGANDNAPPRYPTVTTAPNGQFGLLLERVQTLEELVQDNRRKVQRPSRPNHPSSRSFANAALAVPTDICGRDSLTRAAAPGSGGRGAGGAVCRDGERVQSHAAASRGARGEPGGGGGAAGAPARCSRSFGSRIQPAPRLPMIGLPLGSARWRRGADRSTTGATCRAKGQIARARCIR